tara:strand:+ start:94 stop:258 length:165 start_codon:yes stop_codon:yes gene_type:complete
MDKLTSIINWRFRMKIKKINPIAKALMFIKKQVVPNKKGKGSYNRKKEKSNAKV